MRIGLLAPEDSGKSSFLVALYAVMTKQKNLSSNYPIRFDVSDEQQKRRLDDWFGRLIRTDLGKKRFPPRTSDSIVEYSVRLSHKTTKATHTVTIVDYPGGHLRGAISSKDVDAVREVKAGLSCCDAFVVLLSAKYVVHAASEDFDWEASHILSPSDISGVLDEALRNHRSELTLRGVPIVFCISKFDLLGELHRDQKDQVEKAYLTVRGLFSRFFERGHRHPVMITGISLGPRIDNDEEETGQPPGSFKPFHVDTPFDFCLAFCASSAAKKNRETETGYYAEKRRSEATLKNIKRMSFSEKMKVWGEYEEWVTPTTYYKNKKTASGAMEELFEKRAKDFHNLATGAVSSMHRSNVYNSYVIFYDGQQHKLKHMPKPGELPIEPLSSSWWKRYI